MQLHIRVACIVAMTSLTTLTVYTNIIDYANRQCFNFLQVAFGPRRKKGYGLTDSEGLERLWSFLRCFSSMTKEMTAGRRIDILTDALLHYAQRRVQQFG